MEVHKGSATNPPPLFFYAFTTTKKNNKKTFNKICTFVAELREAFKLHDYDMDGKIFEADVGSCIRSVPGLKPSQHEIDEIKAYMDRGGKCGAKKTLLKSPWKEKIPFEEYPTEECNLYLLYTGTLKMISFVSSFPHKSNHDKYFNSTLNCGPAKPVHYPVLV